MTREKLENLMKVDAENGVATAMQIYDYQMTAEGIIRDQDERDRNDPARMNRELGESVASAINQETQAIVEQNKR